MNARQDPIPWLLTAVPREHLALRRRVRILAALRNSPTSIWRCSLGGREFLLGETGVGGAMVRQSLDHLLTLAPPPFVFLAGFAGALTNHLKVGDGIVASGVVGPDGGLRTSTLPFKLPNPSATLLTSDRLIATPDEKRRLAATHGAVAVDMETSYLAQWCAERAIPWGCVRVISDDAATPVSKEVFELLENGRVSPWRLTKALVRRPKLVRELLHLQKATATAAETIATALMLAANADCPPHKPDASARDRSIPH